MLRPLRFLVCLGLVVFTGCSDTAADPTGDAGPDSALVDGAPGDGGAPGCDTPFEWPVAKKTITIPASDTWKGTLNVPNDGFTRAYNELEARWTKFTIFLADPTKVYFQDGREFDYHYDFAKKHLPPFQGLSRGDFDKRTLRASGQEAVLGAVLVHPELHFGGPEYGIVFEGQDAYHPELVRTLYELVKSKLVFPDKRSFDDFYFPSYHQAASAEGLESCYAQKGVVVSSLERWTGGQQCYAHGWALGRLNKIAIGDIGKAFQEGRLLPTDILLTDGAPTQLPPVAGVISLAATTPRSAAATLAQTYGIPFAYSRDEASIEALLGKEILFRVRAVSGCEVDVLGSEGIVDAALKATILARKKAAPLQLSPKAQSSALSRSTEGLTPADIRYVGGLAASAGLLRSTLPENSPPSVAFTFDLWDGFMAQTVKSGKTLRGEIDARLAGFSYPPDMAKLSAALTGIRELIRESAEFDSTQKQAITSALGPFEAKTMLRFFSSTNVEDSSANAAFIGAGLYERHEGCLADDQDADAEGPSLCAPAEAQERGVFYAMRKVYASFYGLEAYLERLRRGVDEQKVGMALLVYRAPAAAETLANGVATVRRLENGGYAFELLTQASAHPVSDPDGHARPEIVTTRSYQASSSFSLYVRQRSSLVPVGTTAMGWTQDYEALAGMLDKLTRAFAQSNSDKTLFALDFAYELVAPGKLMITQAREAPMVDRKQTIVPFFVGKPLRLCTFQGEAADVFSNHRLKSRWTLTPKALELTQAARKTIVFASIDVDWLEDGVLSQRSGDPSSWAEASAPSDDTTLRLRFALGSGATKRTVELSAEVPAKISVAQTPLLLLSDLEWRFQLKKSYPQPVPYVDYDHAVKQRNEDSVRLSTQCADGAPGADDLLQTRTITGPNNLVITTSFYWPPHPKGPTAGYTAPLVRWVETKIEGLTAQPMVLKDFFSQTYRPEHHNFGEKFVFEPGLSKDLSQAQRDALVAKDVRAIYGSWDQDGGQKSVTKLVGLDGTLRDQ